MAKDITYLGPSPARWNVVLQVLLVKDVPYTITDTEAALDAIVSLETRGVVTIEEA